MTRRGVEWDLLPWARARNLPIMAYSPIEQGRLPSGTALNTVAERLGCDRHDVALAWVLAQPGVIAIPKSARAARVEANRRAADLELSPHFSRSHRFRVTGSWERLQKGVASKGAGLFWEREDVRVRGRLRRRMADAGWLRRWRG